jgi:hypothetical protein
LNRHKRKSQVCSAAATAAAKRIIVEGDIVVFLKWVRFFGENALIIRGGN